MFFLGVACIYTKSLSKQGMQKKYVPEFPVLLALKNYLHMYL